MTNRTIYPQFAATVVLLLSTTSAMAQTMPQTPDPDPVLQRLEALEARVRQLETRNAELEAVVRQAPVPAMVAAEPSPAQTAAALTPASPAAPDFTIKPRGTFQIDYAGFNERAGGYDYSNGTDIRRARFGFDGTAFTRFKWRIEAEYVKNTVSLLDAYVQYVVTPSWMVTVGQHKAPFGLEANTSDSNNTFLERGMASNAFGAVGAERRVGASLAYQSPRLNAALGLFGSGEAVRRSDVTPDEGYGVNGRATWAPLLEKTKLVQLGVSAFHATNFPADTLTIGDRPNVRVDDGRLIEVKSIPGIRSADFVGAEAIAVHGPFSVQGEFGRLSLDRSGALADLDFDGFYVFGSWFLTGEARSVKNGVVDRLKPDANFDPASGSWGAWEVAVRYDRLDLTDGGLSPLGRRAVSWTGALNWYLNPHAKLLFNYIRFKGSNSPLVVSPLVNGTTAKGDAFATRLQFDF